MFAPFFFLLWRPLFSPRRGCGDSWLRSVWLPLQCLASSTSATRFQWKSGNRGFMLGHAWSGCCFFCTNGDSLPFCFLTFDQSLPPQRGAVILPSFWPVPRLATFFSPSFIFPPPRFTQGLSNALLGRPLRFLDEGPFFFFFF